MLLAKEFVEYLGRQVAVRLASNMIEISNRAAVGELLVNIVMDEMMVEDRLNDEVRTILEEYSVYMANNAISYSEMFRRIKNQLVQQRKIVRAAGRDTGDPMRLSRDKVNEISHKLLTALKKSRECRIRRNENDLRLEIVRIMSDILQNEDKADKAARAKIRTLKREVLDGTEEWDLLHKRYYADELRNYGIDLTH
ncbi:MAG: DUF507 family protein [Bryobacteraceae bacterium]|jgi:hypothetical protein